MWAFVVVALHKAIEPRLLLQEVSGRRLRRLFLQRQVHALVATILLRMAGADALDGDAQSQPPYRESAQAEVRAPAGERHAVVSANGQRQAVLLKGTLKHRKGVAFLTGRQGIAAQQVAAREVGDGERIAVALVRQHELALVVGAP